MDQEHLSAVLSVAKRIHDERLAFISMVSHIGDYRNFSSEQAEELKRRGIQVVADTAPRTSVPVTNSPVWSLFTQHGNHLIEGEIDITRYFNSFGEYVTDSTQGEQKMGDKGMDDMRGF
jgi:hypothetical protein